MSNPKISVIVPVYNAEKYLRSCVDSILAQTFTDFELLLIDDGSKDKSSEICDEYARKDKRIKVFHKRKNEGISAAREYGVTIAQGFFIQFVDSDDWIEIDMFERMYKKAIDINADIVGCNFIQEYKGKSIKTNAVYTDKLNFLHSVISNYWGVLWKLLIRRSLFVSNKIHFPKGINGGEDYYTIVCLLLETKTIGFEDFYPYHYIRYNNNSFISTPSFEKLKFQVTATILVEKKLKEKGVLDGFLKDLEKRKIVTKLPILRKYFFKGVFLYPELKYNSIKVAKGVKNKFLLFLSITFCKFHRKI